MPTSEFANALYSEAVKHYDLGEYGEGWDELDPEHFDGLLQEVRDVLDGLADDDCYDSCWHRRGRERGDEEYHSEACQRARALYQRLRVDGAS